MLNLKEKYEELKKYPDIKLECEEILAFFPDYYKEMREVRETHTSCDNIWDFYNQYVDAYKQTSVYKKEYMDEICGGLSDRLNVTGRIMLHASNRSREEALNVLELIDYVGHYPSNKEDLDGWYEKLLKEYDINIVSSQDDGKCLILADDVVRLIETAKKRIDTFYRFIKNICDEEIVVRLIEDDSEIKKEYINEDTESFYEFPPSKREFIKKERQAKLEEKYEKIKNRYFG